jgi:beta-phosphoglucomutase-like phosphatase (HAD superfamily)
MSGPAAVIFDLDGVLIDSEDVRNDARREVVQESGGTWRKDAQRAMMGMSSLEWSRYLREELAVPMSAEEISAAVVERLERLYRRRLPLLPGARRAVISLAARFPLALASSANLPVIAVALRLAGLTHLFRAEVSTEEVARGKPAPDVYVEAARRISVEPAGCSRCGGLDERAARGRRGWHEGDRDPQQSVPAGEGGDGAGRRGAAVDRASQPRRRRGAGALTLRP